MVQGPPLPACLFAVGEEALDDRREEMISMPGTSKRRRPGVFGVRVLEGCAAFLGRLPEGVVA